jgi:hypothetical protein
MSAIEILRQERTGEMPCVKLWIPSPSRESSQHRGVTRSQLGYIVAEVIRNPDVGSVKGNAPRE